MDQIHALALHTYTPDEWAEQGVAPASPTCKGGH
jgi:BolA protein